MLTVYRQIGQLRDQAAFRAWLFKIARNTLLQFRKRSGREESVEADRVPGPAPDPLANARFLQWMEALNAAEREAIMLRYVVLIAACAIAGVVLYRVSRDLESGLLAVSMRYIALMAVVRFAALLASTPWFAGVDWLRVAFTAASIGSDWLLTLVVFYRWRLIRQSEEMMKQYGAGEGVRGKEKGVRS